MDIKTVQEANKLLESLTALRAVISNGSMGITMSHSSLLGKDIPLMDETKKRLKTFLENEIKLIQEEFDNL